MIDGVATPINFANASALDVCEVTKQVAIMIVIMNDTTARRAQARVGGEGAWVVMTHQVRGKFVLKSIQRPACSCTQDVQQRC